MGPIAPFRWPVRLRIAGTPETFRTVSPERFVSPFLQVKEASGYIPHSPGPTKWAQAWWRQSSKGRLAPVLMHKDQQSCIWDSENFACRQSGE
jgi:hypothetical protein